MHHANEALEKSGFTSAVGPDETMNRARGNINRDASQDGRLSIGLGELSGTDHGTAGYPHQMTDPIRCPWSGADPQYVAYHDEEWGVPVRGSIALFSKLTLDTFQSGLSWLVVLRKREAILSAMDNLDPTCLAHWNAGQIEQALGDKRIIRNRAKIEASVNNARCYLQLAEAGRPFSDILWSHVGGRTIVNKWTQDSELPGFTPESTAMAKELKALGFKWTGPTVCYAFMQAVGMVNDHRVDCFRYDTCGG